jgi:hypothetical protein
VAEVQDDAFLIRRELAQAGDFLSRGEPGDIERAEILIERARFRGASDEQMSAALSLPVEVPAVDKPAAEAVEGQTGKPADPDLMYRVGALFGFLCVVAIGASLAIWWTSRGRASAEAVPEGVEEGAEVAAFEAVVESEVVAALERIGA